jgi:hypothetical protein
MTAMTEDNSTARLEAIQGRHRAVSVMEVVSQ